MAHVKKLVMNSFKSFGRRTEILFDKGINVILGPNGSGKSCSYDTVVSLSDGGEIELGKLVEEQVEKSKIVKKLDDGIYVDGDGSIKIISLNKNSMKAENKVISKFIKREGEVIYKIRTATGKELKATGCHPVMVFKEGEVRSSLIRDLSKDELIASPRMIKIDSALNDRELARLMGYIIGDGYVAKDRIEFVNNDVELIEDYKRLLGKFSSGDFRERLDKGVNRIYIRDKVFVEKIRNFFYKNYTGSITSAIKKIPAYFLTLDNESISNLLAGLFDTDGSVRKDMGLIEYCTKNRELARQVQYLLLRFGIVSKIKTRKCRACNTLAKIERDYHYIYISGINNLKRFYDNVPLRVEHKKMNLANHIDRNIVPNSNVDILPLETNRHVRELARLLGIRIKQERRDYPLLSAYIENRCAPTREGIGRVIELFDEKLANLILSYENIAPNELNLVAFMDQLNIPGREASMSIGLHPTAIRTNWATGRFSARPENLERFYQFIKNAFTARLQKINRLRSLLVNLSSSDIFWDRVVSIEKLDKEQHVYDLTIEGNHNFVANNIFAHNSNIADALCFVLGRMSAKSMRAAKAKNMIFMGSKFAKPSKEASVELVFDNSDRAFSMDVDEISLKRIIRRDGQGVYKINDETKTRNEIIELLAQAGIDPYGFNLILQGQIQSIVRMHPEDRRKIIEDVAGISIYEARKEKSIKELEKTEDKLKEINAILRERTAYLRNLEKERTQALHFKELELGVKRCKASILKKRIDDKEKEINSILKSIEEKVLQKEKIREKANELQKEVETLSEKINQINKHIQQASGMEQETLHNQIANLRAEVEGHRVRKENYENRKLEIEHRIEEMSKSIPDIQKEIDSLKKESPMLAKKAQEIKKKKEELSLIEDERRKLLTVKSELNSLKERLNDRERQLSRKQAESESTLRQIDEYSRDFIYKNEEECLKIVGSLKNVLTKRKSELESLDSEILSCERIISISESEIKRLTKIKSDVYEIDVCPLCQSKITYEHKNHVTDEAEKTILAHKEKAEGARENIANFKEKRDEAVKEIKSAEEKISSGSIELLKQRSVKDRKEQLKRLIEEEKSLKDEIVKISESRRNFEQKTTSLAEVEEKYRNKMLEIEEASSRTEADSNTQLLYKERELERANDVIKQSKSDLGDVEDNIVELTEGMHKKLENLKEKEEKERQLNERFKRLFEERDDMQKNIQERSLNLSEVQNNIRAMDDQVNYLKIGKAQADAGKEALDMEISEFAGVELIKASFEVLQERLSKTQEALMQIGSINMRALETYEDIKKEYDIVQDKVNTLDKEKQEILNVVAEIDHKKTLSFMKTFRSINTLFTDNFGRLSSKGTAFLEVENKENIFEGGINIVVRLAKGKYFDVTSLSGGEQTLVALALLFAIQEHKPYHFYIFDEIDAALDKRNSERLAALLNQYMKSGQYIVITHNDAIIMNSNVLYGVSMHDGVSKILSLQLDESERQRSQEQIVQHNEAPTSLATIPEEELKEEITELTQEENIDVDAEDIEYTQDSKGEPVSEEVKEENGEERADDGNDSISEGRSTAN